MHSKVQMTASEDSGGKSLSQHSQLGLSSSMWLSVLIHNALALAASRWDPDQEISHIWDAEGNNAKVRNPYL